MSSTYGVSERARGSGWFQIAVLGKRAFLSEASWTLALLPEHHAIFTKEGPMRRHVLLTVLAVLAVGLAPDHEVQSQDLGIQRVRASQRHQHGPGTNSTSAPTWMPVT